MKRNGKSKGGAARRPERRSTLDGHRRSDRRRSQQDRRPAPDRRTQQDRRPAPDRPSSNPHHRPSSDSHHRSTPDALRLEGVHAVAEALDADVPLRRVLVSADAPAESVRTVLDRAREAGIRVETVDRVIIEQRAESSAHQGLIAEMAPFAYASVEELAGTHPEASLIVVADHITDAGNLGALIRSAEAVGARGLIIPNRRSAAVTAVTFKTSAGAAAHLPIAQTANVVRALEQLKEAGYWVVGASEHATDPIWDADLKGPIALVVGNEGEGLSKLVLRTCDLLVALPMRGHVASLNVAQAATACCYEWLRQNTRDGGANGAPA